MLTAAIIVTQLASWHCFANRICIDLNSVEFSGLATITANVRGPMLGDPVMRWTVDCNLRHSTIGWGNSQLYTPGSPSAQLCEYFNKGQ